jgi:hypothetical protein
VRFKQRAISEFLATEKELVMNIHKRLKVYTASMLLIKALLVFGLHKLQILRKAKWDLLTRIALTGQQQQSHSVALTF